MFTSSLSRHKEDLLQSNRLCGWIDFVLSARRVGRWANMRDDLSTGAKARSERNNLHPDRFHHQNQLFENYYNAENAKKHDSVPP